MKRLNKVPSSQNRNLVKISGVGVALRGRPIRKCPGVSAQDPSDSMESTGITGRLFMIASDSMESIGVIGRLFMIALASVRIVEALQKLANVEVVVSLTKFL